MARQPTQDRAKGTTMSDEIDRLLGADDESAADGDEDLTPVEAEGEAAPPAGAGAGSRIAGMLALVLGILGVLLSLVTAFLFLRALFTASDLTDRAMEPVVVSFDRLEDRIDQADDLIDRRGIAEERVPELRARVDGLVDVSSAADQGFEAIDGHPLYRLLPASLSELGSTLEGFRSSAEAIDDSLGSGPVVRPAVAASMADEIDGMQARVTEARNVIDDASSSLRSWIRLGAFLGFLVALWVLWAQTALARRGWRGLRGRQV
jgi:hypothetical protein